MLVSRIFEFLEILARTPAFWRGMELQGLAISPGGAYDLGVSGKETSDGRLGEEHAKKSIDHNLSRYMRHFFSHGRLPSIRR